MAASDPQSAAAARRPDAAGLAIGAALLVVAALIAWDAMRLPSSVYGVGPAAAPYLVAGGLVALAIGNLLLAGLIVIIGLDGGFIPAVAVLFAATATAMGRRKLVTDLAIGLAIGFAVYLLFAKLLALSLPAGPIENLI